MPAEKRRRSLILVDALVKENKEKSYTYTDLPEPRPGEGELLVRPIKVGLCGSDIHFYEWTSVADVIGTIPFTPGHEMVAEIQEVGEGVPEEYAVGKRVCVENHFFCGKCYQCNHNMKHICQNMEQFGHGKGTPYGGLSQATILPAKYAYLLKTDISNEEAVLLEPFGVAHQAVESINVKDETVLVLGCGPVGLFSAGIAKCMGASRVIAVDVMPNRLEKAKVMGADVVINSKTENLKERVYQLTDGVGVGCLFEATGVPQVVNNCFELLRKGSSIVLIGLPKGPVHIENPVPNLIWKSITLKTVHGRKIFHTWEKSEMMMHRKELPVMEAISHDFALKDFEEAFQILIKGTGCKVLISPNKS